MTINRSRAADFNEGLNTWFKQVQGTATKRYRKLISATLLQILQATPQWSGLAVANWNVSVGEPDFRWNPALGDDVGLYDIAHQQGDTEWINVAVARNKPIIDGIRYRDRVFISNGVEGDADIWSKGKAQGGDDFPYLRAMQQVGSPWHQSLREVNKPYETVQESILIVATRFRRGGLVLPNVGGQLWEES